jgi:hypothetical protein
MKYVCVDCGIPTNGKQRCRECWESRLGYCECGGLQKGVDMERKMWLNAIDEMDAYENSVIKELLHRVGL